MGKRLVITGIGVVSCAGIGKDAFWLALCAGASGVRPISLFDTSEFKAKNAGEISDFRPEEILGAKGLRTLDRSIKLVSAAAKLALDDARLEISGDNNQDIGVAIGTTLGSLHSVIDFDTEAIKEGMRYVNPALFPNTVINSPASQISIRFNIQGFNATVSNGFTASLDALNYAADFIKQGRVKIVLCGGVEELCLETFLGFYRAGILSGTKNGNIELSCPFDKRRNGLILGEGSGVAVLEDLQSALGRKAHIYAELKGFGTAFHPYRVNKYSPYTEGLKRSISLALDKAGLSPGEINYISCGANSTVDGDMLEARAINEVFSHAAGGIPVGSVKSQIGECFSASGAMQLAAAICAIEKGVALPLINYRESDPLCDLNFVANQARSCKIDNVLINAFGPNGGNSSLVISRFYN